MNRYLLTVSITAALLAAINMSVFAADYATSNATATGGNATAVGEGATAAGMNSVAVGNNATAKGRPLWSFYRVRF